ncbi:MAG: hypothetical protein P8R54_31590 [Myxococcota bacterium]|nr:hypothetical protein [Myxococcota bacterium]
MSDTRLMRVGMWAADALLDTTACVGWIHPRHLQEPGWRTGQRTQILHYLRAGAQWAGYRGKGTCRFDGCDADDLGSTDRTDGIWVWPAGLAHYVEQHSVRLPDSFIDTMAARGFQVPPDAARQRKQAVDGEPWLRWCAAQHPLPPRTDAATLTAAQALAEALSLEGCQIRVEAAHDRWLVSLQFPGPRVVDLLPPCSMALLALHIHRWRRVPPEAQLDLDTARALLEAALPSPSAWTRLRDYLAPGTGNLTTLIHDEAGFWRLQSGSVTAAMMPLDETGWRFMLTQLTPRAPMLYAGINQQLSESFLSRPPR